MLIQVEVSSFGSLMWVRGLLCGYRTKLLALGCGGLYAGLRGHIWRTYPVSAAFGVLITLRSNSADLWDIHLCNLFCVCIAK